MSFETEKQLVERLVDLLPNLLERRGAKYLLSLEVSVGRTIADVVAVVWRGQLRPPPLLSTRESVVLASLRTMGPTRIDLLESRCGVERHGLRDGELDRLLECGFVDRSAGGRIALASRWATRIRIIAVEAKLEAWRPAIRQAADYRRYADESFVALPVDLGSRLATEHFESAAVGLLTVGSDLGVQIPARRSVGHGWRREFAASRLLAEAEA